jgi:hypothetical protein
MLLAFPLTRNPRSVQSVPVVITAILFQFAKNNSTALKATAQTSTLETVGNLDFTQFQNLP